MTPTICTYTGIEFDLVDPKPEMVDIRDIAHALSHTCRFGGHTRVFYSVAQHSVLCAEYVDKSLKLQALLHDAVEAYLTDLASPIKMICPDYQALEKKVDAVISEKFGVDLVNLDPEVKRIDRALLLWEQRDLMPDTDWWPKDYQTTPKLKLEPWGSVRSRVAFLKLYCGLTGEIVAF